MCYFVTKFIIYSHFSRNFVVTIYALFVDSANFFTFRMYNLQIPCCSEALFSEGMRQCLQIPWSIEIVLVVCQWEFKYIVCKNNELFLLEIQKFMTFWWQTLSKFSVIWGNWGWGAGGNITSFKASKIRPLQTMMLSTLKVGDHWSPT